MTKNILWFNEINMQDIERVGGKNASLGEMTQHLSDAGVMVPEGFATTSDAFYEFLSQSGLEDRIQATLSNLNADDVVALSKVGQEIREWIIETPFLASFEKEVASAYHQLTEKYSKSVSFAVRSSATAEDLAEASFAGQQETYLNVSGLENILHAIKLVFASLYNDRAIAYRVHHGFDNHRIGLSAGIQRMVRSDLAASGVLFSIDTESGFKEVVFITSSYGLGELIVQGGVNPDEFYVYKPALQSGKMPILRRNLGTKNSKMIYADERAHEKICKVPVSESDQQKFSLNDEEIITLAQYALKIEQHYGRPMDVEWAKDGLDQQLYILQARPETVKSRASVQVLERYQLEKQGELLCEGRSIGQKIGQGRARVLKHLEEMTKLQTGDVLVTDMTDPDWEPIMKRASAIVTNRGGRTCHAAIIARELGIPAVVGCGDATTKIKNDSEITVSCSEGDTGYIYSGLLPFQVHRADLDKMPPLRFKIMLNVGNPDRAFDFQALPSNGVGLARLEFIISQMIGLHPRAALEFAKLPSHLQKSIEKKVSAYRDPVSYYVKRLQEGIATIAAAFYPKPVIVRLSDFKSNEYRNLLGGDVYEPLEENPMLGFRGAGRYVDETFKDCFKLECQALKYVREEMGLTNVQAMIPFVRTVAEAKNVIRLMAENGLRRGEHDLKIIMMCEIPSNALLAESFLENFDGFSIGSNDLTQLTLGLDRDSGIVAKTFDERDAAVKILLRMAIQACKKADKYIGICGQGPSDHPDLARWLMEEGIDSVSLNPDTVIDTWLFLAKEK